MKSLDKPLLRALYTHEGSAAYYAAGALVGHAENYFAASFVGDRRTVFREPIEMKVFLRFLELQTATLFGLKPLREFFSACWHRCRSALSLGAALQDSSLTLLLAGSVRSLVQAPSRVSR